MEIIADFAVNENRLVDYSLDESYEDDGSPRGCSSSSSSEVLGQTLDNLKHRLASMQTTVDDDARIHVRSRVEFNLQVQHQRRRVSCVLEVEKDEEEKRKVKVIKDVVKTAKLFPRGCSLDDSVFRRFSPRRVTMRGTSDSRPLRKLTNSIRIGKIIPKRRRAVKFLKLCFKAME